jgi:hypothetical protein
LVEEIDGVVYEIDPLNNKFPLLDAEYQSIVCPDPGVAEMVTVPDPHLADETATGADGIELIIAATAVLVVEIQPVEVVLAST